jgi:hypothetical protein
MPSTWRRLGRRDSRPRRISDLGTNEKRLDQRARRGGLSFEVRQFLTQPRDCWLEHPSIGSVVVFGALRHVDRSFPLRDMFILTYQRGPAHHRKTSDNDRPPAWSVEEQAAC